jgi:cytidylate kinase
MMESKMEPIEKFNIALDGPVGSGKTTIGKLLAQKLNYNFLDSGLLYRHFSQFYQEKFLNQVTDHSLEINLVINNFSEMDKAISLWQEFLNANQEKLVVDLERSRVLLSSPLVSSLASQLSIIPKLRRIILDFQRELTQKAGWIVVGRDITSEVLPDAKIKIFLTADLETRIKRRSEQYHGRISNHKVEKELKNRDERDIKRNISPLKKTFDS